MKADDLVNRSIPQNIAQTAAGLALATVKPLQDNPLKDGLPFVVVTDHAGLEQVHYIDPTKLQTAPRAARIVNVWDTDSFIEYWKSFSNSQSRIYATQKAMQGLIDEHGVDESSRMVSGGWCGHRVNLPFEQSRQFKKWIGHNGTANSFKSTEELAEFIEDTVADYVTPTAAAMLEMAMKFKIDQTAQYHKEVDNTNGNTKFTYAVDNKVGECTIPQRFTISIPVYAGPTQPKQSIDAYFRYRLSNNQIRLWYDLIQVEDRMDEAFLALIAKVQEAVGDRKIILGTP